MFNGRILSKTPNRGDVIVFKTPSDNRTDYIKRLIALPGDKIQFVDGDLFLNDKQIFNEPLAAFQKTLDHWKNESKDLEVEEISL